jgi:uncharacterized membrane protein
VLENHPGTSFNLYHVGIGYLNASTTGKVARFLLGNITSNAISTDKMSVSMKILMLKYCSQIFLKENRLPNSIVILDSQNKMTYKSTYQ